MLESSCSSCMVPFCFSSRRRHTRWNCDWSSDVCSSDLPAGQSTQMIVGATPTADREILAQASSLYAEHRLRRVYYSAFSPIPDASKNLPLVAPPLVREHRLYQADWLLRFYGFNVE